MKTKSIGHRGFPGSYPENTMSGFRAAVAAGADGIEFDVQLSKDGELVVLHDERVDRTSDGSGWVHELTWKEIAALDAGAWFGAEFKGEGIPHFVELLDWASELDLLLNIELKNGSVPCPGLEARVVEEVAQRGLESRVILSSFNHLSVAELHRIAPNLRTGIIYAARMIEPWNYAQQAGAQALHPNRMFVDEYLMKGAHEAGLQVNTYTVNDEWEMRRMLELGVDAVITNYPDLFEKVRRSF